MTPAVQKETALLATSFALGIPLFGSVTFVMSALPTGQISSSANLALAGMVAVLALVWVMITAVTLYLVRPQWGVVLSCAAALSVSIAGGLSWGAVGGGILLGLLCAVARQTVQNQGRHLRSYRTANIFRAGTRLLVTGVILAVAGIALPWLEGSIAHQGVQVSTRQVEFVLRPLMPVVKELLPAATPSSNIDNIIDERLRQDGVDPATLSPTQRQEVYAQLSAQLEQPITGQESIGDVVASRVNETLQRITQANALTVALVAVIFIFLTFRAVIPLITWLLLGGIAAFVWAARRSGLLKTVSETIEIENLTF